MSPIFPPALANNASATAVGASSCAPGTSVACHQSSVQSVYILHCLSDTLPSCLTKMLVGFFLGDAAYEPNQANDRFELWQEQQFALSRVPFALVVPMGQWGLRDVRDSLASG